MSNQASEDELDRILAEAIEDSVRAGMRYGTKQEREKIPFYQFSIDEPVVELRQAVQSFIRTEKLKLLAEVRERVVGEDLPLPEEIMAQTGTRLYNKIKSEERETLDKLEAEL